MDEEKSVINDKEKEMRILSTLPLIVEWILTDKKLMDSEIESLKKIYPEQYEFAKNTTLEEIIEMNSRYQDSKIYGKHLKVVLSPRGIKWLAQTLPIIREHSAKYD